MTFKKVDRLVALDGFFEAQGTAGIAVLDANKLLTKKWQVPSKRLASDFKEMTQTGVLTLKVGKLYHTKTLEAFLTEEVI